MNDFEARLRGAAAEFEQALDALLSQDGLSGPGPAPLRLVAAMRHGVLGGGKRLRPYLLRQSAAIFGVGPDRTHVAELAVELVHCYSLVHDDLPAMDDDDLRRGRPTVHKAYDEATAILAGDALLTHAFALLADPRCHEDPAVRATLVVELAAGAGAGGMVGGQMRDIEGEKGNFDDQDVARMQAMKTGALIRAAVRMGAVVGGADTDAMTALTRHAEAAGRAFQLADDILDVTATPQELGKATGKDAERGKATRVDRLGLDGARAELAETVGEAIAALDVFGPEADALRAAAAYFAQRQN